METTTTTADDIRRKAAEYDERGDPETASLLRSVADEMDADGASSQPSQADAGGAPFSSCMAGAAHVERRGGRAPSWGRPLGA